MHFKLDENLPIEAKNLFIREGFDTETVYDENLNGCSDNVLFSRCKQEKRILITLGSVQELILHLLSRSKIE